MVRGRIELKSVCPFIDLNDPRCAKHFTLSRLEEAFSLCFGNHHDCSVYHRLATQQATFIGITIAGKQAATVNV